MNNKTNTAFNIAALILAGIALSVPIRCVVSGFQPDGYVQAGAVALGCAAFICLVFASPRP